MNKGKLFLVSTPIGNLEDITYRAIRILKEVEVIAAEDTRVTHKLLSFYGIKDKRVVSYRDNNERQSAKGLIKLLLKGKNISIVSDAGMPVINDPGFSIIKEAIENDIEIRVLPGPSATLTTLVLSNFNTFFTYDGFLNPKQGKRKNELLKMNHGTHIILVTPHNIKQVLRDIDEVLPKQTKVFLGRELTKKFETHYRGSALEILNNLDIIKGEFTMALSIPKIKINKYKKGNNVSK
ncbi:MAG: 16S rRNA (cytidine(1402)-2'-O)-methyltransferase [Mollicutes bacterium PWAP]|nr:16S rRNA (cytidine(1402)-2'-O)-methyltransferase [Mollicutes bacterium PWAP]